ncbi:hypothetical protein Ae201684P_001390 [Aphanomyces euteiches]|nr:hypothetical protein Ae201684P_001390 [Aphanomyces euteiches]KAH9140997.1 hypothetical protein AeRB84_014791 [Aphanomyces euteiches]
MPRLRVGHEVTIKTDRAKIIKVLPEAVLLHIHATARTQWAFPHDVTIVEPSIDWNPQAFPSQLRFFQVQGSPTSNENLVLFLHGLGDAHASLFTLGQAMQLPQTAFASFRAPHSLPFDLGYTWIEPALNEHGDVISHSTDNSKRLESLSDIVDQWMEALRVLQEMYNWPPQRIFLMGFGHGGSVALHVATQCPSRLGGIVSISGALFDTSTTVDTQKTPVLILHSVNDPLIPQAMFAKTKRTLGENVTTKSMPYYPIRLSNKEEMSAVMKFFDETLYLRNLALEAQADVVEM